MLPCELRAVNYMQMEREGVRKQAVRGGEKLE